MSTRSDGSVLSNELDSYVERKINNNKIFALNV